MVPKHRAWSLMRASDRQKWCKHGSQTSTLFGHNLRKRTCSESFLGKPAKFGGPDVQGVAAGPQFRQGKW
eukprot:1156832-Pelagomonas_calceolata.AAC.8